MYNRAECPLRKMSTERKMSNSKNASFRKYKMLAHFVRNGLRNLVFTQLRVQNPHSGCVVDYSLNPFMEQSCAQLWDVFY